MSHADQAFSRAHRAFGRGAFFGKRRRAPVLGAIMGWRGTYEETLEWISQMALRNTAASTFLCPAFLSKSPTHAIGFTADRVALVQFESSRIPPGRHLRFYEFDDVTVTHVRHEKTTEVMIGNELFQVGHANAEDIKKIIDHLRPGRDGLPKI